MDPFDRAYSNTESEGSGDSSSHICLLAKHRGGLRGVPCSEGWGHDYSTCVWSSLPGVRTYAADSPRMNFTSKFLKWKYIWIRATFGFFIAHLIDWISNHIAVCRIANKDNLDEACERRRDLTPKCATQYIHSPSCAGLVGLSKPCSRLHESCRNKYDK